ncbi:hypothetical protein BKP64_07505 [Marinobacter salinus]|uniref:DUF4398 domain-containing protein n=1 Tax=Marinobacter salinus TaxID=1874317 RepID=A0A1D9GK58_9GAMM|nr:DUF4398 domain-containing protein [Marinobacter salinus]AOY88027.1 hypothetical protein BKP64_07505 [Marinobacter salinus]
MKPHRLFARPLIVLGLATALIACAGPGPKPDSQLQSAQSSIQQAEAADARQFEPVLLNQAQNKLADARELIDREQYGEAQHLLEQAAVDAQLAAARSQTERARQAVAEINRSIENLQNQLETDKQ